MFLILVIVFVLMYVMFGLTSALYIVTASGGFCGNVMLFFHLFLPWIAMPITFIGYLNDWRKSG